MPKLIAIENLPYKGRSVPAGSEFEADHADVAILTRSLHPRAREVEVAAPQYLRKDETAEAEEAGDRPARRSRYNRRDLRAAD